MTNRLFLLSFITFFSTFTFAQKLTVKVFMDEKPTSAQSDTIYYDFNRHLTWNDFAGKPDMKSSAGAIVSSGFAYYSDITAEDNQFEIVIGVYTFFTKHRSWKKPGINSPYHLLHEQRHFDITRIGAENLVNELKNARLNSSNYARVIDDIFLKVYRENRALQQQYDNETVHSINVDKQNEWNTRIAGYLQKIRQSTAAR